MRCMGQNYCPDEYHFMKTNLTYAASHPPSQFSIDHLNYHIINHHPESNINIQDGRRRQYTRNPPSSNAGHQVLGSPLCLEPSDPGNSTPGHRDRVILFDILDAFHRAGGNFINIASNPRKPWIEKTIGYWMKMRNTRKDMLGVSDTPAWYVAEANCHAYYARLCRFVVYRGTWSAYSRDFEHEIQPMCKAHELDRIVTQELRKVATKADATIANTALAYMKHVSPEAVPIVRVSSVKQLESRVQALHIKITASDIRQIAAAARIRPIFSHEPLPYTRQQDAA
ncbi:Aldo/keto reductase [Aureobasidium pullulans]|uniref:Aldo/keto reductase n=1 Tax=Aureobasidium pullulans TaxID=5580 RepID=A0A4S9D3A0_AURPU|nr:Aldo/keto reductase [Aureobasidium pullulans]